MLFFHLFASMCTVFGHSVVLNKCGGATDECLVSLSVATYGFCENLNVLYMCFNLEAAVISSQNSFPVFLNFVFDSSLPVLHRKDFLSESYSPNR